MDKHKLLLSFMEEDNTSFVRKSVRMNWSLWMLVWIDSVPCSGLPCPRAQPQLLCQELRGSLCQALALRLGSTIEIFPVLLLFVVNFALWILSCFLPTHPDLALCICLGSQIHLPHGCWSPIPWSHRDTMSHYCSQIWNPGVFKDLPRLPIAADLE